MRDPSAVERMRAAREAIDESGTGLVLTGRSEGFVVGRPDGRQVWVNFAHPANDTVQIIDVDSLNVIDTVKPGKAVLHMEFTPRGEHVWISVRDENRIQIHDAASFEKIAEIPAQAPSGIFFSSRAHRTGL